LQPFLSSIFEDCYFCDMSPSAASTQGASAETAREAWNLMWRIFMEDKPRRWAILSELGLSMQQSMALTNLEPGVPMPMGALAEAMRCDNSNITGIVDRLEAAGLAERRPSERDRRVKAIVLTPRGERMRAEVVRRGGEPPPVIAALPPEDVVALRDLLARAVAERPA
jgi:MarR family transcriptional regulator, organic hydroperoxide resistance regulator